MKRAKNISPIKTLPKQAEMVTREKAQRDTKGACLSRKQTVIFPADLGLYLWPQDWKPPVPAFQCPQRMKLWWSRPRHPAAMAYLFLDMDWLATSTSHIVVVEAMRPLQKGQRLGEYTGEARRYDLWCEEIKAGPVWSLGGNWLDMEGPPQKLGSNLCAPGAQSRAAWQRRRFTFHHWGVVCCLGRFGSWMHFSYLFMLFSCCFFSRFGCMSK